MKKLLIAVSALAITLSTASASQAFCSNGCCSGCAAPIYTYTIKSNGSCCGCAAPIYSYYTPLAPTCCQKPSCCGCAAPCRPSCCKAKSCGCGCNSGCGCGCGCNCK